MSLESSRLVDTHSYNVRHRWSLCEYSFENDNPTSFLSFCSNKAVLNTAPELPLLFLLIQLIIAVVLLHISAFFTKHVELPVIEKEMAKNLTPVVLVNIIGLVFNTLCLRDVETTFFQVRTFLPLSALEADS